MKFSITSIFVVVSSLFVLTTSATPLAERASKPTLAKVYKSCTKANTVAMTFDDGPYDYIKNVTQILQQYNAKGTFFFNGNNARCIYSKDSMDRVKYVYGLGHQIADHTWGHKNLSTLAFDKLHNEMWKVEQAFQRIVGVTPAMMRPPFGEYNDLVRQVAYQRGQVVVTWDFDNGDSTGMTPAQSNAAYDAIAKQHPSSIMTLNHEIHYDTVFTVLPHALKALKAKGYKFVTVADCLGLPAYQGPKKTPPKADPSWWC
jgi:peptidoglycan/xylan/chitin deacetylase (PgdA/CDA1 family)